MTNDYFPKHATQDAMAAAIDRERIRRERFGVELSLEERKQQREEHEARYRRNRAEHFADILATFMHRMTQEERDAVFASIAKQLP